MSAAKITFTVASPRRIGEQGDFTSVLDGGCHPALVLSAIAGHPSCPNLPALAHELAQQSDVLVVDSLRFVGAELTKLSLALTRRLARCRAVGAPVAAVSCHQKPPWSAGTGDGA